MEMKEKLGRASPEGSGAGEIWRSDHLTGHYSVTLSDPFAGAPQHLDGWCTYMGVGKFAQAPKGYPRNYVGDGVCFWTSGTSSFGSADHRSTTSDRSRRQV